MGRQRRAARTRARKNRAQGRISRQLIMEGTMGLAHKMPWRMRSPVQRKEALRRKGSQGKSKQRSQEQHLLLRERRKGVSRAQRKMTSKESLRKVNMGSLR